MDEQATTKRCSRCGAVKGLEHFSKDKNSKDGLRAGCTECIKQSQKIYRQKPEYAEKHRASNLAYRLRNKDKIAQAKVAWNNANREKRTAHRRVWKRRTSGKLVPPTHCELCGAEAFTEASHSDYNQPLLITWLCIPCHRKSDAIRGRAAKGEQ